MADTLVSSEISVARVRALVVEIARTLSEAGIADARCEARDIVSAVLDQERFWPVLNGDTLLTRDQVHNAIRAARLRAQGAPFAYAVGRAAFRHVTLAVNEHVLIPRQETEQLVELVLLRTQARRGGTVVDVGTGSGAIAISLGSEGTFDAVVATDVSLDALSVANANARALAKVLRCPVDFRAGDLLAPVRERPLRAVVSNPPYIAFDEAPVLPSSVRDWEPPTALFGAEGGLKDLRRLVLESADALEPGGLLAIEMDERRASRAADFIRGTGSYTDVTVELDLSGRERFVLGIRES